MEDKMVLDTMVILANELLVSGLEVNKVEEITRRFGTVYGMKEVEVFIITSSILITIRNEDDRTFTQTKRVRKYQTDFDQIERMYQTVTRLLEAPYGIEEARAMIVNNAKRAKAVKAGNEALLYMGISALFTLFFGGVVQEALIAAMSGRLMYLVREICSDGVQNKFLAQLAAAFTCGLFAKVLCSCQVLHTVDNVVMGNVMLLIPGLSVVSSIKDLLGGDMITGMLRLLEALVMTIAIVLGIFMAYLIG